MDKTRSSRRQARSLGLWWVGLATVCTLVLTGGCDLDPRPLSVSILLTRTSSAGVRLAVESSAPLTSVSWVFGDGEESELATPSHTYAARGHYTINVNVDDRDGRHAADSLEIDVGHDWRVPEDLNPAKSETLQTIIDRAAPGDTIWVKSSSDHILLTKDLELVAAEPCVLTFVQYRGAAGELRGFQIAGETNGDVSALTLADSSPTVRDCVFENAHAVHGGAVYAQDSAARFESCQFVSNSSELGGGAVYATGRRAFPSFSACSFEQNRAGDAGGAIQYTLAHQTLLPEAVCPTVVGCAFRSNAGRQNPVMSGPWVGGAIHVGVGCCVVLEGNTYFGNTPGDVAFEDANQT